MPELQRITKTRRWSSRVRRACSTAGLKPKPSDNWSPHYIKHRAHIKAGARRVFDLIKVSRPISSMHARSDRSHGISSSCMAILRLGPARQLRSPRTFFESKMEFSGGIGT